MTHTFAHEDGLSQRVLAQRIAYPFSALVGQEEMKLALLAHAVMPRIGGVLIRGEKGTAKSTAARALAHLLPEIAIVAGCPFSCDPANKEELCTACARKLEQEGSLPVQRRRVRLVELPLGATEDRLLGSIDLERTIQNGARHFEPGLLAAAHRGILYIDEVNLLPDYLVDALLDAAATGFHIVEREGISFAHPAAFILVGTMNPEEGELRPQLLDRFGLSVEAHRLEDPALRAEVVRRRIAFESNPRPFLERWSPVEGELRAHIEQARQLLPQVTVDEDMLGLIVHVCAQLGVDGLRGDLTLYKTATVLAALEDRRAVSEQDVRRAALLALPHRRRRQPFDEQGLAQEVLEEAIAGYRSAGQRAQYRETGPVEPTGDPSPDIPASNQVGAGAEKPAGPASTSLPTLQPPASGNSAPEAASQRFQPKNPAKEAETAPEQVIAPGETPARLKLSWERLQGSEMKMPIMAGSPQPAPARSGGALPQPRGREQSARPAATHPASLALGATLRASAPYQQSRRARSGAPQENRLWLERWDLREPVRSARRGALVLFAVDASGSMAARRRMAAAKGAVLTLIQQAYQARDRVGLLQFRGADGGVLLAPTNSAERAHQALTTLPTGGRTPLAAGLMLALRTLRSAKLKGEQERLLLVLVTDGRANAGGASAALHAVDPMQEALLAAKALRLAGVPSLVIDTEEGPVRLGLAHVLAQALGGSYIELAAVEAAAVTQAVRATLGRLRASE